MSELRYCDGLGVTLYKFPVNDEFKKMINSRFNELSMFGFQPEDIVIVSYRGMQSAPLAIAGRIGKYAVRRFIDRYDKSMRHRSIDGGG